MRTRLLDNELVKKYFGCTLVGGPSLHVNNGPCDDMMAYRVLAAMEEPIKHGDRIILLSNDCGHEPSEVRYIQDLAALGPIHPLYLRIPDASQPEREDTFDPEFADRMIGFKWCGYDQQQMRSMRDFALDRGWKPELVLTPVDRQMKIITDNWQSDATPPGLQIALDTLADLVREEKGR